MSGLAHRLRYFLADAWDECKHSPWVNALAVATLTASLFLASIVWLVIGNVDRRLQPLRQEVRVEVYLRDEPVAARRDELQAELAALESVERVEHVDKAEALRRYRTWAADMAELTGELEDNPLPESLEVFLVPTQGAAEAAERIAALARSRPVVEDVRFNQQWLERLESLLGTARVGGTGLVVLVLGAVVLVMASVLRLAVIARDEEIDIMLLVGASPGFIRGPYLVAGLGQALVASTLALLLVEAVRRAALRWGGTGSVLIREILATHPLTPRQCGSVVLIGLLVGATGAYFAVRHTD